jgi:hypothetical protein
MVPHAAVPAVVPVDLISRSSEDDRAGSRSSDDCVRRRSPRRRALYLGVLGE